MTAMTITEGLAEIKTLTKRLAKKRANILANLYRADNAVDPLIKEGGQEKYVKEELQSVSDLETRLVNIRREIAKANEKEEITFIAGGQTFKKTIAEWLTWRKEVAPYQQRFVQDVKTKLDGARSEARRMGATVLAEGEKAGKPYDVVVNLSEKSLLKQSETYEEILGILDGQLSLKNATIKIEIQ